MRFWRFIWNWRVARPYFYPVFAYAALVIVALFYEYGILDFLAAGLTCTSTVLLAFRKRAGFLWLIAGSAVWTAVALLSQFSGRAVFGQAVASLWTCWWAVWGWRKWR